ncbi:hypothetical protein ABZ502_17660 [Streptomyces abikoensis]|uniref:hypothetical protein n=1 Tax=Streptomyces abikoensis TaxID=97398 RepID=UPI0033FAAC18
MSIDRIETTCVRALLDGDGDRGPIPEGTLLGLDWSDYGRRRDEIHARVQAWVSRDAWRRGYARWLTGFEGGNVDNGYLVSMHDGRLYTGAELIQTILREAGIPDLPTPALDGARCWTLATGRTLHHYWTMRELSFDGGLWDGETRWHEKAFWPLGHCRPNPDDPTRQGATWVGEERTWPDADPRYIPAYGTSCTDVRMVWLTLAEHTALLEDSSPAPWPAP